MYINRQKVVYNRKTINNIYVFILLFSGSVMYIIAQFIKLDKLMGFLFLTLAVLVTLFGKVKFNKNVIALFSFFYILILFNIIFEYNPMQEQYLFNLLTFGMFGMMAALCEFDLNKINKWGTFYGVIWISINFIDNFSYGMENPFSFGYVTLPVIYFAFSYMQSCKNNKRLYYTLFLFLIGLLVIIIQYSGRGALVNILMFIVLKLITSKKQNNVLAAIIMLITLPFLYINFEKVLSSINSLSFFHSDAIAKTIYLIQNDDITNGRLELYINAINSLNGIDWLVGLGLGEFSYSFGGTYVHNLFLNILVDFGLIGLIILLLMILKYFIILFRCEDKNTQNYMIIIFLLSIGILTFSMDYTTSIPLYIFFGIMAKEKIKYPLKI